MGAPCVLQQQLQNFSPCVPPQGEEQVQLPGDLLNSGKQMVLSTSLCSPRFSTPMPPPPTNYCPFPNEELLYSMPTPTSLAEHAHITKVTHCNILIFQLNRFWIQPPILFIYRSHRRCHLRWILHLRGIDHETIRSQSQVFEQMVHSQVPTDNLCNSPSWGILMT